MDEFHVGDRFFYSEDKFKLVWTVKYVYGCRQAPTRIEAVTERREMDIDGTTMCKHEQTLLFLPDTFCHMVKI